MGCFWSNTDTTQMASFSAPWNVSLVINRKGHYRARLDIYQPMHFIIDELPVCIEPEFPEGLEAQIQAEIAEKVKTTTTTYGTGYNTPGYGGGTGQQALGYGAGHQHGLGMD